MGFFSCSGSVDAPEDQYEWPLPEETTPSEETTPTNTPVLSTDVEGVTLISLNDVFIEQGTIQTLIADRNGAQGCFVYSQAFVDVAETSPAFVTFVSPDAKSPEANRLESLPEHAMVGNGGTQLQSGDLVIPLQSQTDSPHGLWVHDSLGLPLVYHNLSASHRLVGIGTVLEMPGQENAVVFVAHNNSYVSGGVDYATGPKSTIMQLDAYNSNPTSYEGPYEIGTSNAVGLSLVGDQILIASAGDYGNTFSAQVSSLDQDNPNEITSWPSYQGAGLNGDIPRVEGIGFLTGSEDKLVIDDADQQTSTPANLAENCGTGVIFGAQPLAKRGSQMAVAINRLDYPSVTMSVYIARGDLETNTWSCEEGPVATYSDAETATSLTFLRAGELFCVATDDTVGFFAAE